MLLLLSKALPTVRRVGAGRLFTPRHCNAVDQTTAEGIPWAADNEAFDGGFDPPGWLKMLDKLAGHAEALWVAVPDEVGNHQATLELWERYAPEVRARGLPTAFVLQDGITSLAEAPACDALFIGGSTVFKMGSVVRRIVAEAKGREIHMGRVNTRRRIEYAAAIGCTSFDGTAFARFTDAHAAWGVAHGNQHPQGMLAE